jgi:MFS family permease
MKRIQHPYWGLAFLTGLNLFNYLDRYVLASVVPPLKAGLALSDADIGWLTSAFMIGYFATAPVFGYLGDRMPRKGLIAFGVAFWSLGTILSGFSTGFWSLLACRVLVGLGEASYAVLAPAWLSDSFPAERRNNAMTIFYVAIPVGSALGYMVGGAGLAYGGWWTGFWWAGAPGLLLALALLLLAEPERAESDKSAAGQETGLSGIASLFRIGDFVIVTLGLTAYTFALGAFAAWGPTFLNRVHGLELGFADHFFGGVLVIGGLLGTLAGGFAATAWKRKSPAGYALLLTLAAFLTVMSATMAFLETTVTGAMVFLGLAIFLSFLPTGPQVTLQIESVPAHLRASAMAASIFVIHLFGDFWSPVLVGRLADWGYQADNPGAGLQHAMLVLPAVMGIAVLFWGWLAWRQAMRSEPAPKGDEGTGAIRAAWRALLRLDNKILGIVLVPIAVSSWVHLFETGSQYWPFISAGAYAHPALSLLASAFSAVYVSGTSILLLTAGQPAARDEAFLPNVLALAGAFGAYAFGFLPAADIAPINLYVPLTLLLLGAALVLLALLYLRRSFTVTPQARAVRRAGPYAIIRHPMYAGNILTVFGLGLLLGTPQSLLLSFAIACAQVGRAYFEERLLLAALPDYAVYREKVGAFLPRL